MSTTDTDSKERIAAITRGARVLGVDGAGRVHLFDHNPTEIWVVNNAGTECLHYLRTGKRLSEWVAFVEQRCGWELRHRIELGAGERLFDPEPAPPTRSEVLGQMSQYRCHGAENSIATLLLCDPLCNRRLREVLGQMHAPRPGDRCPTCGVALLTSEGSRCDGCRRDRPD